MNELKLRRGIVENANFWIANPNLTTYAEVRPIPLHKLKSRELNVTDCSGWIIGMYFAAGAPDPSGNGYDGSGFTGSFVSHLRQVAVRDNLQVGDIVTFGPGDAAHASLVIHAGDGSDIIMGSDGNDAGPTRITLDNEIAVRKAGGFPTDPVRYWSAFEKHPKAKRFVVFRNGSVIGHTNRWRRWGMFHHPFRHPGGNLRFHDRKGG